MFRERTVVICSALGFVVGFAVFGMVGYLPGLMQAAFGLPATVAGHGHPAAGARHRCRRASGRDGGPRAPAGTGVTRSPAAPSPRPGWPASRSSRTSTPPVLVGVCAGLVGVGVGVLRPGDQRSRCRTPCPPRLVGTATSTVALVRELGVTLGAAALGGLLSARLLAGLGPLGDLARRSPEQLPALPAAPGTPTREAYLSACRRCSWPVSRCSSRRPWSSPCFLPDRRARRAPHHRRR